MRTWSKVLLTVAALVVVDVPFAVADPAYPTHSIRIVVNTAAGGFVDVTTRLVAQQMSEYLKQAVIVENRAGGDGLIGIRVVKSAPADGYTLLATAGTIAQQMALRIDPGYDLVKDFVGVGTVSQSPFMLVVPVTSSFATLADVVKEAKAHPGKLSYASAGVGTAPHFAEERFIKQMGLQMVHVPYKGNAPAVPDLISGRVDIMFDTFGSGGAQVTAGRLKALAITSRTRSAALPNVPTFIEAGVPGFTAYTWVGIVAPSGTPADALVRLFNAIQFAKSTAVVKNRFRDDGTESMDMNSDQFNAFLGREVVVSKDLVAKIGIEKH